MKPRLKPLGQQTIVLTGATSGIGLVTARMAAKQGAKLVLTARNAEALRRLADELASRGAKAAWAAADVANLRDVQRLADVAQHHFGGFDTWINDAGVSIYGRLGQVPLDDDRRLFETNFWGVVNGSLVAIDRLRKRGGCLINIGSVLSDRAIPLQGMYSASKHAVKGFTDALRMEVEEEGLPISITLVKPSAIDTPYTAHARNFMGVQPQNLPPVYAPDIVARTILRCAQRPIREIVVGGAGAAIAAAGRIAPRLTDRIMERSLFAGQKTDRPLRGQRDALHRAGDDLRERGGYRGPVFETSPFTEASMRPVLTGAAIAGAGLAAAALWQALSPGPRPRNGHSRARSALRSRAGSRR